MAKIKEKKTKLKKKTPGTEKKKITRKATKPKLPKKSAHQVVRKARKIAKIKPHLTTVPKPTIIPREIIKEKIISPRKVIKKEEKPVVEQKPLPSQASVVEELKAISKKSRPPTVEEIKIIPKKVEKPPIEEKPLPVKQPAVALKTLELNLPIIVKDLAIKLQEKPSLLIKTLMGLGLMAGINQTLEEQAVVKACQKYGYQIKKAPGQEELALRIHQEKDRDEL